MTGLFSVGRSVRRLDALEKVTGKAGFCSDLKLPGMLYVKVVRSPVPHGRIVRIDTSEAKKVPGVECVLTDWDGPQAMWGEGVIKDKTILARDVVRYVGEPVIAIAARSIDAAEKGADRVKVTYMELPAIFDAEEAMGENPPVIVHPEIGSYVRSPLLKGPRFDPKRPNVFTHMTVCRGNVERGFHEADLVLENKFTTAPVQNCPLEPHAVVVRPEADGGLTFWTGRQALWTLKNIVGEIFGIRSSKIRVVQQYVGGAFGGKMRCFEVIAALLALKTGRPVKWVFTREEEFIDGGAREPMILSIRDGVSREGILLARQMRVILKGGAYENFMGLVTRNCGAGAGGDYRIPNFKWDSYGVYTNEPPKSPFRGFGITEVAFAVESQMDMLAQRLGISPVELRKRNLLQEGEANVTGEITHSIGTLECLEKARDFIGLGRRSPEEGPWRRGKGIAIGSKYSAAPAVCGARIQITEDESFILYHGADEVGQGVNTAMAQIVADEFGVTAEDVRVVFSDTLMTPLFAHGTTSSRVTFQLGNAVQGACQLAKQALFEKAAKLLAVPIALLETRDKKIYVKEDSERSLDICELFRAAALGEEISGQYTQFQDNAPEDFETGQIDPLLAREGKRLFSFYAHVAKAAEVAVNVDTGQVKVFRCCSAVDLGKMINPQMCEQQSEGGMAMGISDSIFEELLMDQGRVLNPDLTDYRIVSATDLPSLENMKSFFIESTPHQDGPFGAKGFAEGAMIGMEPAIANAIYDAVGVRIKELPIAFEKVKKAIDERNLSTAQCSKIGR